MSKNITDALSKLDPQNDNHWTADGLPRLDTIKILAGNPGLTREQVTAAAPEFNRAAALAAGGAGGATPAQGTGDGGAQAGAQQPPAVPPAPPAPPAPPESDLPQLNPAPLAEQVADSNDLKSQIEEANIQLSDAISRVALAKQEVSDAQNYLAKLESQLKESAKGEGSPITEYLRGQQRAMEERAARKKLIHDSGINLKELAEDLKSPLDASLSMKNGRPRRS